MSACPVCGFESPEDATECHRCHLARALFEPVRDAVGDDRGDPGYLTAVGALLAAVESPTPVPEAGVLSAAGRFPPLRPAGIDAAAPRAPGAVVGLPALPPAGEVPSLLRQVNDYLQVGRRQGIDLAAFADRARDASAARDRDALESLARELFVHLAASLTEEYERALGRRNELSGLVPTASPDVELEGCRAALAMGDLAGAQRRLRHVGQELGDLEEQWATVQILLSECDLMAATIRELGGDPEPALGPVAEGRRLAREGNRASAEPVLAGAGVALWALLAPAFLAELARAKDAIVRERAQGGEAAAGIRDLRQVAVELQHRNFAAAIATFRRLRPLVEETPGGLEAPGEGPEAVPRAPRGSA